MHGHAMSLRDENASYLFDRQRSRFLRTKVIHSMKVYHPNLGLPVLHKSA